MSKRKKIPHDIKLKLWVLSGGRCEFPGCNKLVWRDGLTLKEDNFAHMAHVVASSPGGPRGHEKLSEELEIDFDNLLLLCFDHSRLVDGRHSCDYTVDQLKEYKIRHEDRIRRQTAIGPEYSTTVVRFQAPIGDRRPDISTAQTYEAVCPRFPSDEKGVFINFSGKAGGGDAAFWAEFAREIKEQVRSQFRIGNDGQKYEHLSIFALAPIPALMLFGNQVGNIVPADIYQKHRDTDDWKWKPEPEEGDDFEYRLSQNDGQDSSKVALVLSLSGKINPREYTKVLRDAPVYEIEVENANPGFLMYRSRLDKFRAIYRQVISEVRSKYGEDVVIHLFPAVPAPIAVLCGKELLPKSDPSVAVYDNDRAQGGFIERLLIN